MNEIRTLRADEIECRAAHVKETKNGVGCSLLLYKDARCDMRILDEVYGAMGWERHHEVIDGRLYCTISVRNPETGEWISKQDVGTESNTEKEKGQASDSFKRAGFNWGIGRELYSAPFIWIPLEKGEYSEKNGRYMLTAQFTVREIGYNEKREIDRLVIVDKDNKTRYRFSCGKKNEKSAAPQNPEPDVPPEPKPEPKPSLSKLVNDTKRLLVKLYGDAAHAEAYWKENIAADENDRGRMEYHYKAVKSKVALMEK